MKADEKMTRKRKRDTVRSKERVKAGVGAWEWIRLTYTTREARDPGSRVLSRA